MDETQKGMQSIRNAFGGNKPKDSEPGYMDQVIQFLQRQMPEHRELASIPNEPMNSSQPAFNPQDIQNVQQSSGFGTSAPLVQSPQQEEIRRRALQKINGGF